MKHIPMRSCIVCRQRKDKSEFVRIVRLQDGTFDLDTDGKISGRGAYVCKSGDCAKNAIAKRALNRAFKQDIPNKVYDRLQAECERLQKEEQNAR